MVGIIFSSGTFHGYYIHGLRMYITHIKYNLVCSLTHYLYSLYMY